jgi:hypothetical protein
MQGKANSVAQYLERQEPARRQVLEAVRAVILENLDSEFEEGVQYGMIGYYVPHRVYPAGYHVDPKQPLPFAALAAQKNHFSLYLMGLYEDEARAAFEARWRATGKRLDMGKSCIRFTRLDQLALDVLADSLRGISARSYVQRVEQTRSAGLPRR